MHRKQVMVWLHSRQRSQSHAVFSGAWPKMGRSGKNSFPTSVSYQMLFFFVPLLSTGGHTAACCLILFKQAGTQAEVCHYHHKSCGVFFKRVNFSYINVLSLSSFHGLLSSHCCASCGKQNWNFSGIFHRFCMDTNNVVNKGHSQGSAKQPISVIWNASADHPALHCVCTFSIQGQWVRNVDMSTHWSACHQTPHGLYRGSHNFITSWTLILIWQWWNVLECLLKSLKILLISILCYFIFLLQAISEGKLFVFFHSSTFIMIDFLHILKHIISILLD